MFYKTMHELAWKRIVICEIKVSFKINQNCKLSRYGAVLLSFLKRNDQKTPNAAVQVACSIQFKIRAVSVFCHCSLCKCLFAPCWISLTLMQITVSRHLIFFPFSLTITHNVFLHFWACFLLAWRRYIISFYSKFLKIFYESHLGNSKFYLIYFWMANIFNTRFLCGFTFYFMLYFDILNNCRKGKAHRFRIDWKTKTP